MVRIIYGGSRSVLLASLCVVTACSSANENAASDNSATPTPAPAAVANATPPPSLPVSQTSLSGYDASIGTGVDADGFADLPLRAGAHRYFVNSATGADTNGCAAAQQPTTPLRSIASAIGCVADSQGDQVLVAAGTTYAEGFPSLNGKRGFSPAYPTVIQTYDPADPLNDAKYGHITQRPVINTGANAQYLGGGGGAHPDQPAGKLVIRGFDFNPGNVQGLDVNLVPSAYGTNDYVLMENNVFRATAITVDQDLSSTGQAQHLILRNNSIYGQWNATGHVSGAYVSNTAAVTFEDNVFWHNGWKVGVSRDADKSVGGLAGDEVFRHAYYLQTDTTGITVRRNLIVDGAADGGQNRGSSVISENVYIDQPTAIACGGGTNYNTANPNGVDLAISYNAILGDADITSTFPRGEAIHCSNGRPGSSASHNLIVRSRNPNGVGNYALITEALFNLPSYMSWDHNVVYQWASASQTTWLGGTYQAQDFATYTNNIWDAPSSGTNTNNAGATFPNPYSAAQLYSALGFADKQSFINYAIEHPEAHIQRNARSLLFAGYGLN